MKPRVSLSGLAWAATVLALATVAISNVFGQQTPSVTADPQQAAERAQHEQKLQQVTQDKLGYAVGIVQKWEQAARAIGKWNDAWATDLENALVRLDSEKLLAAGEAVSYKGMLLVLSTGRPVQRPSPDQVTPTVGIEALGDPSKDMVFNALTPCRIIDTIFIGAPIPGDTFQFFEADVTGLQTYVAQGGSNTNCNLPDNVAWAVAITLTVTNPVSDGYLAAWGLGPQPLSSVITYSAGQTVSNTTIVPIVPGPGADFTLYTSSDTDVIADLVGFFSAPAATPLDCTTVASDLVAVPVNSWTNVDAFCPAGRTATGGGYNTSEGTLGYPGVWTTTLPITGGWRTWVDNQTSGARHIQTFVNCCRVPGR